MSNPNPYASLEAKSGTYKNGEPVINLDDGWGASSGPSLSMFGDLPPPAPKDGVGADKKRGSSDIAAGGSKKPKADPVAAPKEAVPLSAEELKQAIGKCLRALKGKEGAQKAPGAAQFATACQVGTVTITPIHCALCPSPCLALFAVAR